MHTHTGKLEQGVLRRSIAITAVIATTGVVFGLVSGSQAILFDGVVSLVDGVIVVLSLAVSRLLMSEGSRRFQFGYWHFEPIVVAFNGTVLMLLCLYALLNAVCGLPRDYAIGSVDMLDGIRAEIGAFIGEPGPQRWLTITFTGDASAI